MSASDMSGKHRARKSVRHRTGYVVAGLTAAGSVALVIAAGTAHADVDWAPLIQCESGGRPTATNPSSTASGLFQFLDSSWRAYGGGKYAARAKDATPAQQYEIANHAYAMSGLTPWAASRSCWGGKVSTTAKPAVTSPGPVATSTYVVRAGDTLATVASAHATTWQQLAQLNHLPNPDLIYPGQQLRMP
jgi:LysM repeat protein